MEGGTSVLVRLASIPDEPRALTVVRRRIFAAAAGVPPVGEMVADFFDVLPTTSNVVALVDGDVVGEGRLTVDSDPELARAPCCDPLAIGFHDAIRQDAEP